MTRVASIFSQILQLIPRLEFESAVREHGADALIQSALREEVPISVRCGGEAARHRNAEACQAGNHLADRSVLAADEFDVFIFQLFKWDDVRLHGARLVRR